MKGQLISTKADFPRLQVFLWPENDRPVFGITFRNREIRSLSNVLLWFAGTVPACWGMAMFGGTATALLGIGKGWPLLAMFLLVPAMMAVGLAPQRTRRAIEMDFGRDQFRVLRNGRTELTRQLTRLKNLTIEPHPRAMIEYEKRGGKLGPFQKLHCLFGFFGAAGAEKVLLVSRWEYPSQESLLEVLKAIQWVAEQVNAGPAASPFVPAESEMAPAGRGGGIKPPLD